MRISDWSSDLCSSDLAHRLRRADHVRDVLARAPARFSASSQPAPFRDGPFQLTLCSSPRKPARLVQVCAPHRHLLDEPWSSLSYGRGAGLTRPPWRADQATGSAKNLWVSTRSSGVSGSRKSTRRTSAHVARG